MRIPLSFTKTPAKLGLLLLLIAITSCNALKRVNSGETLLTKNTILTDSIKEKNGDVYTLLAQQPNSALLGYPLRLNLYNLAKKNPDSAFTAWLQKKDKRQERLEKFLSPKQVKRLGTSFLVKGSSVFLKKIGEQPTIIDTTRTKKSLERLKLYYGNQGYFNAKGSYSIDTLKRKQRANITYHVALGKPFIIDSIATEINSPAIDSIYNLNKAASLVKPGDQFNHAKFTNERERLTGIFRNSGVYNFQESAISYDISRDTVADNNDQKMQVTLRIDDLKKRTENSITTEMYQPYTIDKVNIYTDHFLNLNVDSLKLLEYENFNIYYKDKLRYKPKALTDAIFLKKGETYRFLDRVRTYRQISSLNTFKYPTIDLVADTTTTTLTTNIFLAPRAKSSFSIGFDVTHSNIQRLGTAFSSSLITRNVFGGAETLSISARGSLGFLSDASISDEDYVSEIGADINLNFPRLWFPFVNTKNIIPSYMIPQTRLALGTSNQQNVGLDKQTFNSVFGYSWSPSEQKKHSLELINVQYVRNLNPERFFKVYQNSYTNLDNIANDFETEPSLDGFFDTTDPNNLKLTIPDGTTAFTNAVLNNGLIASNAPDYKTIKSIEERRKRLTENNLIFTSNYTFTTNNKESITDSDFSQFRFKLESAGNLLSLLSKVTPFKENEDGKLVTLNVPFSQYIKTEFDYIKHWDLNRNNIIAFRGFVGAAIPYGNADNIPFTRSYFAGGSNDNRAWNAYSLGPGNTNNINDFNEANFKLAFNLEYRFPIVGDIKGALFADAGNIWNLADNVDDEDSQFNGLSSLQDIALGTGFGLRYDFTYFVFRLDLGFKTYNPAEEPNKKWFRTYNFANVVPQIGINYPF